jgi:hypothetical protein
LAGRDVSLRAVVALAWHPDVSLRTARPRINPGFPRECSNGPLACGIGLFLRFGTRAFAPILPLPKLALGSA